MLPESISLHPNTMIAPVQHPSIIECSGFEAPGMNTLPQYGVRPVDFGPIPATAYHIGITPGAPDRTKRPRGNSQHRRGSVLSIGSMADSDFRGTPSYQVVEYSATPTTHSKPKAASPDSNTKSSEPDKIRKWPNAFILFRAVYQRELLAETPADVKLQASQVSTLAGIKWRAMPLEEKTPYREEEARRKEAYLLAKAKDKEDKKLQKKEASKRQRESPDAPTPNKRINTGRMPSSSFYVPPPSMAGSIGVMPELLPQSTAAFINMTPGIPLPQAYMPADTDYLTAGASLQAAGMSSFDPIVSGDTSFMQSPVPLPAVMHVPTQMPAAPTSQFYPLPNEYLPSIPNPSHSFASTDPAVPASPINYQTWINMASTVLFGQAAQGATEALPFANSAVSHTPLTTAESNAFMGQPAYTQDMLPDVISSNFSTVGALDIPASLSGLDSTIADILSIDQTAISDLEQAGLY